MVQMDNQDKLTNLAWKLGHIYLVRIRKVNSMSPEINKLSLQASKSFLSKMRTEKHFVGLRVLANSILDWVQCH